MNKFKSWKYIACAALVLCLCAALVPSVVFATESETVLYVGSTGAGHYATLAAAIEAIPEGSTRAVVVITEPISATNNVTDKHVRLPKHDGELVITSKYGSEDYTDTATINLFQYLHLNGDTTFENIVIAKGAKHLYADFHKLHLGEGIELAPEGDYVADHIFLGRDHNFAPAVKDVTFIMDSGVVTTLNGGNRNQAAAGGVDITINGGTVGTVFASGNGSQIQTHTGDIKVTVNGGTVGTVASTSKKVTVKGNVTVTVNSNATQVYGVYTESTVTGDVTVNLNYKESRYDVTVGTLYTADGGTVNGNMNLTLNHCKVSTFKGVTGTVGKDLNVKVLRDHDDDNERWAIGQNTQLYLVDDGGTVNGSVYAQVHHYNAGASMRNLNGYKNRASVKGDVALVYDGGTWTNYAGTDWNNFDTLVLKNGARVTIYSQDIWNLFKKVVISDNSCLVAHKNVTNTTQGMKVEVTASGDGGIKLNNVLIQYANKDNDHTGTFEMVNGGYELVYSESTTADPAYHKLLPKVENEVRLNGVLRVKFYLPNSTEPVQVKINEVPVTPTASGNDNLYWVDVMAQDMLKPIEAKIYFASTETYIMSHTFKLEEYVGAIQAGGFDTTTKDLANAALTYCQYAAACKYPDEYEATANVSGADAALDGHTVIKSGSAADDISIYVYLDEACDLCLAMPAQYADANVTIDGNKAALTHKNQEYICGVSKMLPEDYDKTYTFVVNNEGTFKAEVSVLDYIKVCLDNNYGTEAEQNLMRAMYYYNLAAKEYLNAHPGT